MAAQYDLSELGKLSGTPPRTIRYYIQERLLPRPHGKGPKASYGDEHLDRLLLIRSLQDGGETLEMIRGLLEVMDDAAVNRSLSDLDEGQLPLEAPADSSSALDYIRTARASSPTAARLQQHESLRQASLASSASAASPGGRHFSTWQHIALTPDIELHARRPLPRSQRRDLEELLEAAKEIFGREIP